MSIVERSHGIHRIEFPAGTNLSQEVDLRRGAFGCIVIPAGSDAIGRTVQFVAVEGEYLRPPGKVMPDADMLSTPKALVAGANRLTAAETQELSAIGYARLKLDSNVAADTIVYLMWKS